jgi:DNA (cytosine-5)-methyltransferase 1
MEDSKRNTEIISFGSICSGIEAASVALEPIGYKALWFSEIADFPSQVLKRHYPEVPNVGDMNKIPSLIENDEIEAPDFLCGGTPCQAFSLAGWREGLCDTRGSLTLKFIEIANSIDKKRKENGKDETTILWENVEGVLSDKTNAFGNFLAGLAGVSEAINCNGKWPRSGFLLGPRRNVAWRILDSKYFGVPQQRRRLYVIAGGRNSTPEEILFERESYSRHYQAKKRKEHKYEQKAGRNNVGKPSLFEEEGKIEFEKSGEKIEIFREYTDCLYSAYATKWNGNAAAYNGSLYVAQNGRLRRLTPLECERLMGFPDNYTKISQASDTSRYHAIGNSWVVPVIRWLGSRIYENLKNHKH